jgi:uncharacterized membrane protein YfcA
LGTMVVSSVVVDVSRLIIYGLTFFQQHFSALAQQGGIGLVIAGSAAAFVGSFIGSRLLEKITLKTLKYAIAVMLLIIAAVLGMGII